MLATKGVKKPTAEKALEALAAAGKLVRKEYGKSKIYWPSQEGRAALTPEESAAKQARIKELQDELRGVEEQVVAQRRELAASNSSHTDEQMQDSAAEAQQKQAANATKLAGLRSGARLISAADVAAVEKACKTMVELWGRHRRDFRSLWNNVSEGLSGKEEALFEEMGVDSDKMVGADFEGAKALSQPVSKGAKPVGQPGKKARR
ncbi:homologous-pairing 2-like protein [Micractinium conductrix]|uniref:Homologous-pairing 2-like protein n=1 Tax=Micractinium conductrix TaxID=554055 RepID=A0A2P6V1C7_9CHLO|nr:homologous-pairing 2-like protein [Micractinium conductrix]|eukprot:PSC67907.1 homologous-pairing 2-like protein [Micractinium conductrix]